MVNIKCKSLAFLLICSMLIGVAISSPLLLMDNVPLTAEKAGLQGGGPPGCNGGGTARNGPRPAGPRPTTATANATTAASG